MILRTEEGVASVGRAAVRVCAQVDAEDVVEVARQLGAVRDGSGGGDGREEQLLGDNHCYLAKV